ncbi:MAG TPA: A/G-specific adenine glycosylase [Bryobacteraceae bacterium]|nr:A/G-specific adenine glycosylase [Bryobacteraceae bacterium]
MDPAAIRRKLTRWYKRHARDLPWRRTRDPYAIWISEVMLQQTRVAAAIPYYHRFLERFPNAAALAGASETEVLALWSGLGYYSRARKLREAAQGIVGAGGEFPRDYGEIRALPGIGEYTAAAVSSIAFGLPHAAIDGNVRRVVMRLTNNGGADVGRVAEQLLDRRDPGRSNQALMEFGAVVCLPRAPLCRACPVADHCGALRHGTVDQLPPARVKPEAVRRERTLLVIRRGEQILLEPSSRVKGFWDLPDPFPGARLGAVVGMFRHSITRSRYICEVREATAGRGPRGARWFPSGRLHEIALSTTAKKALRCLTD